MMEAQTNNPNTPESVNPPDASKKAEIIVFFAGGARMHAQTNHTSDEVEKLLLDAANHDNAHHKIAVLQTENEEPEVEKESLLINTEQVLFYSIRTMKPASAIAAVSPLVDTSGNDLSSRRKRR